MLILPLLLVLLLCLGSSRAKGSHGTRKLQTASITLAFRTDLAPEELGWVLFDSRDGTFIGMGLYGTFTNPDSIETITLSVIEDHFYTLQLIDSNSDGICCSNGTGNLTVYLGSEVTLDGVLAFSDGKYGSQQFLSFQASMDATTIIGPSQAPSEAPTTTSQPSIVPSIVPSSSSIPTITPSPTVTIKIVVITIAILMDNYPFETGWKLLDSDNEIVNERSTNFYSTQKTLEMTTVLVTEGTDYTFKLTDSFSDGIIDGDARIYLGFPDTTPLAYTDGNFGSEVSLDFVAAMSGIISVPPPPPTRAPVPTTTSTPNFAPFAPTLTNSATVSPSGLIPLVDLGFDGCSVSFPCDVCQGDCDSDNECLGELVCYQGGISLYEIPPECFNAGDVTVGLKDFCAASQSSTPPPSVAPATPPPSVAPATPSRGTLLEFLGSSGCTVSTPCDECQGDCDRDLDCRGNLKCFQRSTSGDPIPPGCADGGSFNLLLWDFCYKDSEAPPSPSSSPVTLAPVPPTTELPLIFIGINSGCTASSPCGVCEGDCDSDADCAPGLRCFDRDSTSSPIPPGCFDSGSFNIADWDFCGADEVTAPIRTCPLVPLGGCSVCGVGLCVGNPDGSFAFSGQPSLRCDLIESVGLNGLLESDQCPLIAPLIFDVCGCQPDSTSAPQAPVIIAPSSPVVSAPPLSMAPVFPGAGVCDDDITAWDDCYINSNAGCSTDPNCEITALSDDDVPFDICLSFQNILCANVMCCDECAAIVLIAVSCLAAEYQCGTIKCNGANATTTLSPVTLAPLSQSPA